MQNCNDIRRINKYGLCTVLWAMHNCILLLIYGQYFVRYVLYIHTDQCIALITYSTVYPSNYTKLPWSMHIPIINGQYYSLAY